MTIASFEAIPEVIPPLDVKRLRGILAEEQIYNRGFARDCWLGEKTVGLVLREKIRPSLNFRLRVWAALGRRGIDYPVLERKGV